MSELKAESSDQAVTTDDVIKALGRLTTLTYQQRQMVNDGDVLPLMDQLTASQTNTGRITVFFVFLLAIRVVFGFFEGQLHWISGLVAVTLVLLISKQKATAREVDTVVRRFADSLGYRPPTQESLLLTELRSGYALSYDQHQMLKAGKIVPVAQEIVKSTKRSIKMQTALMSFCCLPQLVSGFSNIGGGGNAGPNALLYALSAIAHGVLVFGFIALVVATQTGRVRRLEEIIGAHEHDTAAMTAGSELESDRDSPYRSPMFR